MVFSPMPNYINHDPSSNWNHQDQQANHQQLGSNTEVHHYCLRPPYIPLPPHQYPPIPTQPPTIHHQGIIRPGSMTDQARKANMPIPENVIKCPRCASMNTKFCYYNNYSLSQPRYLCKNCRRYWTQGGSLRNVPVGGGCKKNKRSISKGGGGGNNTSTRSKSPSHSGSTPSNNSGSFSSHNLIRKGSHIQPSPVSFMAPLNHLSDYNIADIGANYLGLIPQVSSSPDHFNRLLGNANTIPLSSGIEPYRFIQQQQQLEQRYHHLNFLNGNTEVPLSATTPLYGVERQVTATKPNEDKQLNSIRTTTGGVDAQMDLLKLERNLSSYYINGINRAQLVSSGSHQSSWRADSENKNANNNGGYSSSVPSIAWTDPISGYNSSSSNTILHPS